MCLRVWHGELAGVDRLVVDWFQLLSRTVELHFPPAAWRPWRVMAGVFAAAVTRSSQTGRGEWQQR